MTTPNTNPSDLDREALKRYLAFYIECSEHGLSKVPRAVLCRLRDALTIPRASGVPEAEAVPVAWVMPETLQEMRSSAGCMGFIHSRKDDQYREPLYASPPPVAAPSGWKLVPTAATYEMQNAAIDIDSFRLGDISPLGFRISPQKLFAQCYAAMLAAAPPSPIASEPKDAGSGEGQPIKVNNLGLIKAVTAYDQYWENHDDASEAVRCAIEAYLAFTLTAPSGAKPGDVE